MGGLYTSVQSSEISWKRRALRVTSEALLCLGVATIVASFVIDITPDKQKPNIWILIGGVLMILAAAIGWALTFCLIWETSETRVEETGGKNPIHSVTVVVPNGAKAQDHDTYLYGSTITPTSVNSMDERMSKSKSSNSGKNSKLNKSRRGGKNHGRSSRDDKSSSKNSKNKKDDRRRGRDKKDRRDGKSKHSSNTESSSGISTGTSSSSYNSPESSRQTRENRRV